jgi:hypothetical protein
MANITVSVNRNMDDAAINALLNGEDVTINTNATLTINSDSRWGQQAAVIGAITIDAGTGGICRFDGRDVWWMAYDAPTGNVPALGTAGVQDCTAAGGATGEFLGIFTALGVAPTAAAAAIPATGFIKFRSKVGTFVDNEVVTLPGGATITVNSATGGVRGWLHIVGEDSTNITVPRVGKFESFGDWFELGTGSGATGQTLQYYAGDICPAVQVETSAGSGVYEWWVNAGSTRWAQNNRIAQDARGKYFNCTTAGVITFALRGAVNVGAVPPTGAKIRVPNIHVSNSSTVNFALNTINTTIGNRWEFITSSSGDIRIDKTAGAWYVNCLQPYAVNISYSSTFDGYNVAECATEVIFNDCAVGLSAVLDGLPLSLTSNFTGVTITNGMYAKYEGETGDVGSQITDCANVTITGARFDQFGDNTAATLTRGATTLAVLQLARVNGFTLTNVIAVGAALRFVTCSNGTVTGTIYADTPSNSATTTTGPVSALEFYTYCADIVCSGLSNLGGIANVHPYNGFVAITNGFRFTIENLGTFASPFNSGSANAMGVILTLLGNGSDFIMRRGYTTLLRTSLVSTINSDTRVELIDVRGDYADSIALNSLNTSCRGLACTPAVTGLTAVYGTHILDTFTAATTGRILFIANEPTSFSAAQCAITSGTPQFTSTGNIKLLTVGDQVTWTMDYFALGHTALANIAPTFTGTNAGNHSFEFQWDTGSGWNGTWLAATGANLSGVGAIDPATGIKLKVRATCTIAATTNAITFYRIDTVSTSVAQGNQYPLPGYALTLTGLIAGSEVRAFQGTDPSTAVEIGGIESSGTSFVLDYAAAVGGTSGYIVVFALGYQAITIPLTYPSSDSSIPIQQVIDRVYANA